MSDGDLRPILKAYNKFSHTDGSASNVVEVTLPSVEGHYHFVAEYVGGNALGTNGVFGTVQAYVRVDGGSATVTGTIKSEDLGATGYSSNIAATVLTVRFEFTAANAHLTAARLRCFGIEQALAIG